MGQKQNEVKDFASAETVISPADLLAHFQGHRSLTRRLIEAFPEDQLFTHSIGGMRTFGDMVMELLSMAGPGIKGIATDEWKPFEEKRSRGNSKEELIQLWDAATEEINHFWPRISAARFQEVVLAFGQYEDKAIHTIFYFIDNEIHHRGQGYVYLRSLGITPPNFWER